MPFEFDKALNIKSSACSFMCEIWFHPGRARGEEFRGQSGLSFFGREADVGCTRFSDSLLGLLILVGKNRTQSRLPAFLKTIVCFSVFILHVLSCFVQLKSIHDPCGVSAFFVYTLRALRCRLEMPMLMLMLMLMMITMPCWCCCW